MGILVDVDSETFLLPKENFAAAKRALEALATEEPSSFALPQSVAGCADLQEALAAALWRFETNETGDLVALGYGADKAPGSDEFWPRPVLEALAPFVTRGTVVYHMEHDDRETVYTLAKGKLRSRTRKRTKPKSAPEPAAAPHAAWVIAPPDSFGVEWRVRFPGDRESFFKRDRVAAILETLATTKLWRELEEVHYDGKVVPITARDGVLPVDQVVKRIADSQWSMRWLASRDRETTLELVSGPLELQLRLRVRDGALARVGTAVIDEVAPALARYARAHRAREPVVGQAAPFGCGYVRPADAAGPVLRGPEGLVSGKIHFRAHALATIFDARAREKSDDRGSSKDDETTKTIGQLAAANTAPHGAKRTEEDDMVVITVPCDLADRESVRAAAAAHASWIAASADVTGIPSSFREPKPMAKARTADDPALEDYALSARFELIVEDDPYYFRDRAFFEVVYRAFAKTAYWPRLAKPGPAAVDAAIAAVKTGRNDARAVLKSGDAVQIELAPNVWELVISVRAAKPVLTKLGARATRDLVAFLGDVHGALASRGRLRQAYIKVTSKSWDHFVGRDHPYYRPWPPKNSVVDILEPLATEDGRNGRELHLARTLAAAPLPPGAERVEAGGLVALVFADELSDPVATAEACASRAAWLKSALDAAGVKPD